MGVDKSWGDLSVHKETIRAVEFKISDLEDELPKLTGKKNAKRKKEVENSLEELRNDPKYRAALAQIAASEKEAGEAAAAAKMQAAKDALKIQGADATTDASSRGSSPSKTASNNAASKRRSNVPDYNPTPDVADMVAQATLAIEKGDEAAAAKCGEIAKTNHFEATRALNPVIEKGMKDKKKVNNTVLVLMPKLVQVVPIGYNIFGELVQASDSAKLAKSALKTCNDILHYASDSQATLVGFFPLMLDAITAGSKWKPKVTALNLLLGDSTFCPLDVLWGTCKKQMTHDMPRLVVVLYNCCTNIRGEIKDPAAKLLGKVGAMVKCAEIQTIAPKIINCLINFGDMNLARDTLYLIANTTFLSYVDAASFALLFPIVERAMKERQFESKKNGIMIVGAAVVLIEDPIILESYLDKLLPILMELALDPTFEIQREAAKAIATLARNLPDMLKQRLLPWCLDKLKSTEGDVHNSENERVGSAHSLSEIMNEVPHLTQRILKFEVHPRIFGAILGNADSTGEERAGAYGFIEFLCKRDNVWSFFKKDEPQAKKLMLLWCIKGFKDETPLVRDKAYKAACALINEFGGLSADIFAKPLIDAVLCFDDVTLSSAARGGAGVSEDAMRSPRDMCMRLFRMLVERVGESRAYGTDMYSMACCGQATKEAMIILLLVCRSDADPGVRREVNKVMSENLQSMAKTKKAIMPVLLATLKSVQQESQNANKKNSVERCIAELKEDYEVVGGGKREPLWNDEEFESADPKKSVFCADVDWSGAMDTNKEFETILGNTVRGSVLDADVDVSPQDADAEAVKDPESITWAELNTKAQAMVKDMVKALDPYIAPYAQSVILGCILDSLEAETASHHLDLALPKGVLDPADIRKNLFNVLYEHYHPSELKYANDKDILCRVENLMLMYGGGHLLLKDTVFELRKGRRYGVVGRNGAGKTTLMNLIASGGVPQIPKTMTCIHVKPEVLDSFMTTKCIDFMALECPDAEVSALEKVLERVLFPESLWRVTIGELSGGWRMRLLIAGAMMKKADVLLLDEPTNHLDTTAVQWLSEYLVGLMDSAIMVISHDPGFLNVVCTDIINYNSGKLVYYTDCNYEKFTERIGLSAADSAALLAGQVAVGDNGVEERLGEDGKVIDEEDAKEMARVDSTASGLNGKAASTQGDAAESSPADDTDNESALSDTSGGSGATGGGGPDRKAKIVFPIPGKVKGLTSLAKPVLEVNNLTFAYNEEKGDVIQGVSARLTMNSRVHVRGVNGAGKSTFINLVCGEVHPNSSACPQKGTVARHRNCRLAYMAQQHMHHLSQYLDASPVTYLQKRFANGYDEALQERLTQPRNPEEAEERAKLAKVHGKYGNQIRELVGRQLRGKEIWYEVAWENLPDQKQNTTVNMDTLRKLGCETFALAYDDKMASLELDPRPLTQREITKHLEQFGITEELALNRKIGMFSAGQKSKVSLAAAFWTKPHVIALDEPTNYIDQQTLDALTTALQRFKGGVICISHAGSFVKKVCNETWHLEAGQLQVFKGVDVEDDGH